MRIKITGQGALELRDLTDVLDDKINGEVQHITIEGHIEGDDKEGYYFVVDTIKRTHTEKMEEPSHWRYFPLAKANK